MYRLNVSKCGGLTKLELNVNYKTGPSKSNSLTKYKTNILYNLKTIAKFRIRTWYSICFEIVLPFDQTASSLQSLIHIYIYNQYHDLKGLEKQMNKNFMIQILHRRHYMLSGHREIFLNNLRLVHRMISKTSFI